MPAIVLAPIKITSVTGQVNFGDVVQIAPKSSSKNYLGAAANNTGDFSVYNSLISMTNTLDPDVVDDVSALNR